LELPRPTAEVFTAEAFTARAFTAEAFMAQAFMAEALMAEAFMTEAFMTEAFTIGVLSAGGDFGVADSDTMASSALQSRTPQPKRLLFLQRSSLRPLFRR
jgi:hypothetical protein